MKLLTNTKGNYERQNITEYHCTTGSVWQRHQGRAQGRVFHVSRSRTSEAIRQFQEALRLEPDYAEACKNLDVALANRAASPPQPGASSHPCVDDVI
jgi:Flp pilus assembly protein TadD